MHLCTVSELFAHAEAPVLCQAARLVKNSLVAIEPTDVDVNDPEMDEGGDLGNTEAEDAQDLDHRPATPSGTFLNPDSHVNCQLRPFESPQGSNHVTLAVLLVCLLRGCPRPDSAPESNGAMPP